jgi:hypothetical protein
MISPQFQTIAQMVIGRILNSLPEGLLVALFAWVTLRLLPRQNSGTRFAVWFVALLAVAGLPLIGGIMGARSLLSAGDKRPLITLPGPWGILLFLVWLLAVCATMLRLAAGLWRLRGLRKSCSALDLAQLAPAIRKTVSDFSSSRSVILATSEKVNVPSALGFFRPMIVIPAWAMRELPPEELNIILLHEFAHLRRWDDWTNLLQKVVRAIFVFHPAIWWIDGRLSLEREMACDDVVLTETANPRGYAKCLITLLEKSVARRGWTMAQAAVHRAREASMRLAQILDANRPQTKRVWMPALSLVSAFSLLCLVIVPRTPRFVAFTPSPQVVHGDSVPSLALSRPQFAAPVVIPAALHVGQSSANKKVPRTHARLLAARVVERQLAENERIAPQVIPALWVPDSHPGPTDAVTVSAKEIIAPGETLLVVRTSQRLGQNSWAWSISVWRVTLVNRAQIEAERTPVANNT